MGKMVRIGCGAGFWGDTPEGPAQLVRSGAIDYLVLDYLAEITMSILARMKGRNAEHGYATDFVTLVMKPLAREIAERKIRVVANAGGVNPRACRRALQAALDEAGVNLRVAVVEGDDLLARADEWRARGVKEMFSGAALPERLASVNAYLGARPIAEALALGADIVLTGRCVDSALTLGPLMYEFGWQAEDYDRLAAGSLAGHVIECGAQATGGIFTDWREVADGWSDMGFPIAECEADGAFTLTKPAATGGRVTPATVAEQIVYEVGDPGAYLLPDVTCDFRTVELEPVGDNRVRVSGARGRAPTASYKVSATYADGFRAATTVMIAGRDAAEKADAVGRAVLNRARRLVLAAGFADFSETSVEILGAEATYGAQSRARATREVLLKVGVRHPSAEALKIFAREVFPAGTSMAQGLTGFAGGRPQPQPVIRLFSFLIDKSLVASRVRCGEVEREIAAPPGAEAPPAPSLAGPATLLPEGPTASVPLIALAHARSGDKGDIANIGVIGRRPEYEQLLRHRLTADAVKRWFAHYALGPVERFDWPAFHGFNFLLHGGLGGGGVASLRHDPQGKALAQALLDLPIEVPAEWLQAGGLLAGWSERLDP
ncbi:MAG TPA: acyclic terpene utilization AtuA family protein [Roseiarcus sp.]|nr:acyclic terpene utilization AtuA family protein [Roseiarcus sp.]